jgi:hypothetical protein
VAQSGASIAAEEILFVSQKSGGAVLIAALLRLSQMTGVASCARLHGNITEMSPILTSSVLAAFEGVRRVRHRSPR